MLVLSRKWNEEILIGDGEDEVRIVVIDIVGDKVKLGIDARPEIRVHRREVKERIDRARHGAT